MPRIDTTRARAALEPRPAPYWHKVGTGLFVGLRMTDNGTATWNIRYRHPDTDRQEYRALGDLLALDERERFAHAEAQAIAFKRELDGGANAKPGTVAEACARYVEERRKSKGQANAHDAERRFKRLVYGGIGDMQLADLRASHFADWRDALVDLEAVGDDEDALRRARESCNRNASVLRAALNLSYERGFVATNPWQRVKQFAETTGRRTLFLTPKQRAAILKCANEEPEVRAFIEAGLLTCLRPGALAKLKVSDFDARIRCASA